MTKGRYYRIRPSFWQDPKVRNNWTEDMRMLALYLTTSPHRNMIGLFYCPLSYMEDDLQWKPARLRAAFEVLSSPVIDFCRYDQEAQVVLLVEGLRSDAPSTERQVQGALRIIGNLPPTSLLHDLANIAATSCLSLSNGIRMTLESHSNDMPMELESHSDSIRVQPECQSSDIRTPYSVLRTPYTVSRTPYTAKPDTALESQSTADTVDVSASVGSLRPEEIAAEWNEICGHRLPAAQKLTADRRRHIKARLQEPGRDLDWWREYFRRIAASEFCCGGSDGTGWRASFDWAVQSEATVIKVLEGQYDTRAAKPKGYRPAEILR